jgi:hypothetical protein
VLCGVNPIPVTVAAGPADLILLRVFLFAIVLFLGFRRRQISVHLGLCWPPPIRFSLSRCCCARSQSTILIFFPREVPRDLFRWSRTESNSVPGFFFCRARFPFRPWLSALGFPATCLRFLLVPFNPVAGARRLFSSPARRFLPLGLSCHRQISKFRFRLSVLLVDA